MVGRGTIVTPPSQGTAEVQVNGLPGTSGSKANVRIAYTVNIGGGTLTTGGADKLANNANVTLSSGGKTVKQSTRRATFITTDELVEEVGVDVFRFFMVERKAEAHLDFRGSAVIGLEMR